MINLPLSQKIKTGIFFALLTLIGVSIVSTHGGTALYNNNLAQSKSYIILDNIDRLFTRIEDAETSQRGYIITGSESYLNTYNKNKDLAKKEQTTLSGLKLNSAEEESLLRELDPVIKSKFAEMDQIIALRKTQGFAAAQAVALSDQGKDPMDKIRTNLEEIRNREKNVLDQGVLFASQSARSNFYIIFLGNIFALILFLIASIIINRDISQQKKADTQLSKRTEDLEIVEKNLKKINATLDQHVIDVEEKNKGMEDDKKAATNVLEDLELTKEKIEKERVKVEAILKSIGDGTIITNGQGIITRMNVSAENMLGLKATDVVGRRFVDVIPAITEKGVPIADEERPMSRAFKTGEFVSDTVYYGKNDNTTFPASLTVTPVILNHKIIGAIEIIRDSTKAMEIDKAKTEFVSLASHQLRTPLSTISWYAELLLSGDVGEITPEQKKFLEEIYSGNRRMVELVNALLNVSRIELGMFIINPAPTDVVDVAKIVLKDLKPIIDKRGTKIKETYAKDIPKINADKNLVRIIFQNVLTNAIKYTDDGGKVDIAINTDCKDNKGAPNDHICITVSDNGYGIPKAQQDKIFTKLFRADNVAEKDTEGTGLGLYIVKSVLDNTGGTIRFESEENKGTTFYVTLPLSGMKTKTGGRALE